MLNVGLFCEIHHHALVASGNLRGHLWYWSFSQPDSWHVLWRPQRPCSIVLKSFGLLRSSGILFSSQLTVRLCVILSYNSLCSLQITFRPNSAECQLYVICYSKVNCRKNWDTAPQFAFSLQITFRPKVSCTWSGPTYMKKKITTCFSSLCFKSFWQTTSSSITVLSRQKALLIDRSYRRLLSSLVLS